MLRICQIDWREVGVAFELQCLRNCTLSNLRIFLDSTKGEPYSRGAEGAEDRGAEPRRLGVVGEGHPQRTRESGGAS